MNFRAPWVSSRSTAYRMSRLSSRSGAASRTYRSACLEPWSSAYRSSRLVTACAKVGALGQLLGPGQGRLAQLPVRLTAGRVNVDATALSQGRTQQLWRVDFTDESGRLIAHGELRLQNVAGKS